MAGPKKNTAFTFGVSLTSQADTDIFKTSPTLAAGDVTVSIDGGNFANIGTLPTQIQTTGVLPVALTAAEMNGDKIYVLFHDAAGSEWQDLLVFIDTETGTISEINTDVESILADTGTDGVVVNSFTAAGKAEVESEVDDALGGGTGTALTAIPWNAAWDAEVESEANDAIVAQKLDHLVAVADADDAVDSSIVAKLASKSATPDWSSYTPTTDSLEAQRDNVGTAGAGLTAIWQMLTSTMTTAGSIGKLIVDYLNLAVGSVAAAVLALLRGSGLVNDTTAVRTVYKYTTFSESFTVATTGYTTFWATMKTNADDDADTASIIQIKKNSSGVGDGLLYLNGAAPVAPIVAASGSITIDSATQITVTLDEAAMASVAAGDYTLDVCSLISGTKTRVDGATIKVRATETRATS